MKLNRKTIKSPRYTRSLTGGFQVPFSFLEPAISGMRNPLILRMAARIGLNVDTGSAGGPARLFAQALASIFLTDGAGPRLQLPGASARVVNYAERSGVYRDGADIAATQTAATQDYWIDLMPCNVVNQTEIGDHALLVSDFLNGGELNMTWGADTPYANYITFNAGTFVEIWCDIVDGVDAKGNIFLPPRHVWMQETISNVDQRVKAGGLLKWAINYVGASTETTRTGHAAQNFTSNELELRAYPVTYFRNRYIERAGHGIGLGDAAAVVATEDTFARTSPQAVMLFGPERGQSITDLALFDSFQVATDGAIPGSSPALIKGYYTKRSPELEQAALRAQTAGAAQSLIAATGVIGSSGKRVDSLNNGMGPFLPVWVRPAA